MIIMDNTYQKQRGRLNIRLFQSEGPLLNSYHFGQD